MQCIQSITHKPKHMQCIQSLLFFSSTIHIQMAAGSMNFKLLEKKNTEKKRNWKKVMKLWMSQMRCMLKSFGDNHKKCWNFWPFYCSCLLDSMAIFQEKTWIQYKTEHNFASSNFSKEESFSTFYCKNNT